MHVQDNFISIIEINISNLQNVLNKFKQMYLAKEDSLR